MIRSPFFFLFFFFFPMSFHLLISGQFCEATSLGFNLVMNMSLFYFFTSLHVLVLC